MTTKVKMVVKISKWPTNQNSFWGKVTLGTQQTDTIKYYDNTLCRNSQIISKFLCVNHIKLTFYNRKEIF